MRKNGRTLFYISCDQHTMTFPILRYLFPVVCPVQMHVWLIYNCYSKMRASLSKNSDEKKNHISIMDSRCYCLSVVIPEFRPFRPFLANSEILSFLFLVKISAKRICFILDNYIGVFFARVFLFLFLPHWGL